jgi:protein-S-isoprenylcysteine O-methyltransferase Ste14
MNITTKQTKPETARVIAPPPLIFTGCYLLGYVFERFYPTEVLTGAIIGPLGITLITLALSLAIFAIVTMKRAGTSENPYKPSTSLVRGGPYKFTRNPMYLALSLLYMGIALLLHMLWPFLTLPIAILTLHFGVITREERYLKRLFSEEYTEYCSHVRRWI